MVKFRIRISSYVDIEAKTSEQAFKSIFTDHMNQVVNNSKLVSIGSNEL